MSKQASKISLTELIRQAEEMIRNLNYCDDYINKSKIAWRRFSKYSLQRDIFVFDEEIAASFLKEQYNYPDPAVKRHSSYVNSIAKAIQRLSDLQQHGRFLGKEKKKLLFITPEFKSGMSADRAEGCSA